MRPESSVWMMVCVVRLKLGGAARQHDRNRMTNKLNNKSGGVGIFLNTRKGNELIVCHPTTKRVKRIAKVVVVSPKECGRLNELEQLTQRKFQQTLTAVYLLGKE